MQNDATFRPMRRFKQQLTAQECDWWYHVSSVVCFGQVSIVEDHEERMEILKSFGKKY